VSDSMIILRAVYRVIELAQGWRGYLITHEAYFYCLDTAPMIICMGVWILGHPGVTLGREILEAKKGQYAVALEPGNEGREEYRQEYRQEYRENWDDVDLRNVRTVEVHQPMEREEERRSHESLESR